jgi:hypothetical protein
VSRMCHSSGVAATAAFQLLQTHASLGAIGRAPCLHTAWKICVNTAVGS